MRRTEIISGGALASFRSRRDAVTLEDIPDHLVRDVMADVG
jgi:hypothetical protein